MTTPNHPSRADVRRLTPVLIVDRIEPCMSFWIDRLGFTQTVSVPHGGEIGFVILEKNGIEIMYQSRASVADDVPGLDVSGGAGTTSLFIEVTDLGEIERAMSGADLVFGRRHTFYGMDEICVREPGGRAIVFAQPAE